MSGNLLNETDHGVAAKEPLCIVASLPPPTAAAAAAWSNVCTHTMPAAVNRYLTLESPILHNVHRSSFFPSLSCCLSDRSYLSIYAAKAVSTVAKKVMLLPNDLQRSFCLLTGGDENHPPRRVPSTNTLHEFVLFFVSGTKQKKLTPKDVPQPPFRTETSYSRGAQQCASVLASSSPSVGWSNKEVEPCWE